MLLAFATLSLAPTRGTAIRMAIPDQRCVILADRHHGFTEGIRGLLDAMFTTVVMVADEASLHECAGRLRPAAVIADLSLARSESLGWLKQLRASCPHAKLVVLSVHDEACVCAEAIAAGADGFIVKRAVADDLMPGVDAVMDGEQYVSPCVPWPKAPASACLRQQGAAGLQP